MLRDSVKTKRFLIRIALFLSFSVAPEKDSKDIKEDKPLNRE